MEENTGIFLPTLHTFAMDNIFTGSKGLLRFRIVPEVVMATPKEVNYEASTLHATYWHGLFCYEKSTMEQTRDFPLTDAGREEMLHWLESKV